MEFLCVSACGGLGVRNQKILGVSVDSLTWSEYLSGNLLHILQGFIAHRMGQPNSYPVRTGFLHILYGLPVP